MTTNRKLLLLALVLLASAAAGVTLAAFSSQTSNSGNSFSAAASFATLQMETGSYTGNGADNRNITGVGFEPEVLIIKASNAQAAVFTSYVTEGTDSSKPMAGATAAGANRIQDFVSDGFQVGTDATVNTNGVTYYWTAFRASADVMSYGLYVGNGATSRTITGVGFQPEYVMVGGAGATPAVQRIAGMTRAFDFGTDTGATNQITGFAADGFSVGNAAEVNTNGQYYAWVAFNEEPGLTDIGSYTGNGTLGRTVTGVGFQPEWLNIRANDTATARRGHMRPDSLAGTSSQFFDATSNTTNGIRALQADGFQLGTDASVNANGPTYWYFAAKGSGAGASGCTSPGTQTLSASADSFVASGGYAPYNFGAETTLYVVSGGVNARSLVSFNLPAKPTGCSVTSADLRLYDATPTSGRTIEAYQVAGAWTETGVTWNNQPATTGSAVTASSPAAAGWMQWTVTSQVNAMYSGTNHGFLLRDSVEGSGTSPAQIYDSSEVTTPDTRPELVLTFG